MPVYEIYDQSNIAWNFYMTKQILYPKFTTRVFATMIDVLVVTTVSTPIVQFLSAKFFIWNFQEYLIKYGINLDDPNIIAITMRSPEFATHVTFEQFAIYVCGMFSVHFVLFFGYCIYFWHKMGWTPGKYILGLRIVDSETLEKLSISQCIKRLISYPLALFSIWFIGFTQKCQGWHDKVSGTLIIKR